MATITKPAVAKTPASHRRRGVTLAEAIVSTAIVGIMLAASLEAMTTVVRNRQVQLDDYRGRRFAAPLMAEVLQAFYDDPAFGVSTTLERNGSTDTSTASAPEVPITFGPEDDELTGTRGPFDDVDDYSGWSEQPPAGRDGNPLPGSAGWSRGVTVDLVNPVDPTTLSGSDQGLKWIAVTVTDPDGKQTALVALRSRFGIHSLHPLVGTPCVSWVRARLLIGADAGSLVETATHLPNNMTK